MYVIKHSYHFNAAKVGLFFDMTKFIWFFFVFFRDFLHISEKSSTFVGKIITYG